MGITIIGTPASASAGIFASDILTLVRDWLADYDTGDPRNPGNQAPRFDDPTLLLHLNRAIDDVNLKMPQFGLAGPSMYSAQGHITSTSASLAYPAHALEPMAHRVAAAALETDSTDQANLDNAARHTAFYQTWITPAGK